MTAEEKWQTATGAGSASVRQYLCGDATSIVQAVRARAVTATEIVEALLAAIAVHDQCNAMVLVDADGARRRAMEADAAVEAGRPLGPLHGVPFTVKDAFDVAGLPTTVGHPAFSTRRPTESADAVNRMLDAGAILVGKSNCAPLCCDVQTNNSLFGRTTNPWNRDRTSGGSSGGEAAAVALGLSPLGIASDTGGSIRIPSAYCGVLGFKPSLGTVSRAGLMPTGGLRPSCADSLTTVGVIARSVRDLSLCYEVLSGSPGVGIQAGAIRLACTLQFATQAVADEISILLENCIKQLTISEAISIEATPSPVDIREIHRLYMQICLYEFMPREFSPLLHGAFKAYDKAVAWFSGAPDAGYRKLKQRQQDLAQSFDDFLSHYDAWLLPSTPTAAFSHCRQGTPITIPSMGKAKRTEYMSAIASLTYPANLLGNPSITIPVAVNQDGMPVGLQLVGRRGQNQRLLAIAGEICRALDVDAGSLARKLWITQHGK